MAAATHGKPLALVLIDIDRFKLINDRLGHAHGDRCLIRVAELLRQQLPQVGGMVARLGGEEFGVVLSGIPAPQAAEIAERMRRAVAQAAIDHPEPVNGLGLTVSLGLVSWTPLLGSRVDLDDLLQRADNCLYAAKRRGRDRLVQDVLGSTPRHRTCDGSAQARRTLLRHAFETQALLLPMRSNGRRMGAASASILMNSPDPGLADWLDLDDAVLPVDFASHLEAANLARVLERLDRRQHRMALLLQAMVQLLEAQGLLSEKQLLARSHAMDLSDGVADGRQARQTSLRCGRCGRENLGNRQRCLYCGSEDLRPMDAPG